MLQTLSCAALGAIALAAALAAGPAQAADRQFTLSGNTDDVGPLAGMAFSGSFAYAASMPDTGFSGSIDLRSFSLRLAGQTYDLASADAAAVAVFADGAFLGLDYADVDSDDPATRPNLVLVAGFTEVAQAYLAYAGAGGLAGFGSYTVSAVPEPASLALLLAGLGLVGAAARRRR